MDSTTPYYRTQTELLADIEADIRDTSNVRWSDAEIYRAINRTLLTWHDKVKLERVYTISGGFVANTREYTIPAYVRPPIFPEIRRRVPHYEFTNESTSHKWVDVPGWELAPAADGTQELRLYATAYTVDAQVVYYAPNSRVPLTIPTTNAQIDGDDTSVTMGSAVDIDDVGTVKIDAEYITYSGVTRAASTTTLSNLIRAQNGSSAATHNSSSNVTWCVGVDTMSLLDLLYNQVKALLMAMPLTDGSTHERGNYERQMGWYDQLAQRYWPTYRPVRRRGGMTLNQKVFALRG